MLPGGPDSRAEMTEDRSSKREDRPTRFTHSEQQREERLRNKTNRASEICGTITQDPTFVSVESQKTERMGRGQEIIKEIMSENVPILTKDIEQTPTGKPKKIHTKTHHD